MKGSMDVGTISSVLKSCMISNTSLAPLESLPVLSLPLIWQKKKKMSLKHSLAAQVDQYSSASETSLGTYKQLRSCLVKSQRSFKIGPTCLMYQNKAGRSLVKGLLGNLSCLRVL